MDIGDPSTSDTRRRVLVAVATGGIPVIAGCADLLEVDDSSDDTSIGDDRSPAIEAAAYEVRDGGTRLYVRLRARAPRGIEEATVEYGDRRLVEGADGIECTIEGFLEDVNRTGEPGEHIVYRVLDVEGAMEIERRNPRSPPPTIDLEVRPTGESGTVEIDLRAADDEGLAGIRVSVVGGEVLDFGPNEVGGTQVLEETRTIDVGPLDGADLGRLTEVTGEVADWNGNRRETAEESYVREFDRIVDPRLDVGAYYVYFFEDRDRWDECTDACPDIGRYGMDDREAVSRHVDLMQGFGISRLIFQADWPENGERFLARLEEPLPGSMPLEIKFNFRPVVLEGRGDRTIREQFDRATSFFRDNFLTRSNYVTIDGRPVVTIMGAHFPVWNRGELWEFFQNEWGGYGGFVEYLRAQFSTDTAPHLIGMVSNLEHLAPDGDPAFHEAIEQYDAFTHWFGGGLAATTPWEELKGYHVTYFPSARDFAEDHEINFNPTVFHGFDDRSNDCWGDGRYVPRDPDHLQEMLELAEEYRTGDRVNVATFNDWPEATAIEPGTVRGSRQGTEYLERIADFVE